MEKKQIDLRDCPATAEYLGLGSCPIEESMLACDIDNLNGLLIRLVTMMDEDGSLADMCIKLGYAIANLKEMRDELLRKGGVA